jgi:hypothetical protein
VRDSQARRLRAVADDEAGARIHLRGLEDCRVIVVGEYRRPRLWKPSIARSLIWYVSTCGCLTRRPRGREAPGVGRAIVFDRFR